ncbi:hypothetical protein IAR55_006346 [Kwoniella newhampshirensis]|uniref:NmrA-like domain-containing protein n=1 Tax=Kwoniella newhampshirensis TaxID=1651941 RepID=A0AAW0YV57_9TREE
MTTNKTIVAFGATGTQGTAMIQALTSLDPSWIILALTRNPESSASKRLASLRGVKVIKVAENCMEEPDKVFASLEGVRKGEVHGVFSVQGYENDKNMVKFGVAIADAAKDFGVKHIVYSSSQFGGLEDTGFASLEVKRKVEIHIKSIGLPYTFLRPVQFMDIWTPNTPFQFRIGRTVWLKHTFTSHPDKKLQLVSPRDIGIGAARAFINGPGWKDGVVDLAGDALTTREIEKIYKDVWGGSIPLAPFFMAWSAKRFVPIVRDFAQFFVESGWNVDIDELRKDIPELEDYETYARRYKAEKGK